MAAEIERKFLVCGDAWRDGAESLVCRQGYLSVDEHCVVRVRIMGSRAWLTVKGPNQDLVRPEFDYLIPCAAAAVMLGTLARKPLIEKTRHLLRHKGQLWEIDEFTGDNAGLVIAEAELDSADAYLELPPWAGREVSGDARYYNANLVCNPYKNWKN